VKLTLENLFVGLGLALWLGFLVVDAVVRDRRRRQLRREMSRMYSDYWVLKRSGHNAEALAKIAAMDELEAASR